MQGCGHGLQSLCPGGQLVLFGPGMLGLRLVHGLPHAGQQGAGALFKRGVEARQRFAQPGDHTLAGRGLGLQRLRPRGLFAGFGLGLFGADTRHGLTHVVEQGIGARFQRAVEACQGIAQAGHHGLAGRRLRLQGRGPGGPLALLRQRLFAVLARQGLGHIAQQRLAALFQCLVEPGQGVAQSGHQFVVGFRLLGQGLLPGLGHGICGGAKLAGQAFQLRLHRLAHLAVQTGGLLGNSLHRRLDHRLDGLASQPGTGGQGRLKRLRHRMPQVGIGRSSRFVEALLTALQLLVELLAALLNLTHEGLQLLDHGGQGVGLRLHGGKRSVALESDRERMEHGGNARVQRAHHSQALAAAEGGHETQHGRGRHTGHRGSEGKAQALDGRGESGPDGLQIGRAFQREHGALERHHHAQKRPQHAEHHQQADQVRRERQPGQGRTLAFDALANAVLQGLGHAGQPVCELVQRLGNLIQRGGESLGQRPVAPDLQRADQERGRDGHGHRQGDVTGAHETGAHPENGDESEHESGPDGPCVAGCVLAAAVHEMDGDSKGVQWLACASASTMPAMGCKRRSSSASNACWHSAVSWDSQAGGSAASVSAGASRRNCSKRFLRKAGTVDNRCCSRPPSIWSITASSAASRASSGEAAASRSRAWLRKASTLISMRRCWST